MNGTYQIGYWPAATGSSVLSSLVILTNQLRQYLVRGLGSVDRPTILFARYGSTSVGLYIGQGLENRGIGENVLSYLSDSIASANASLTASVAMQFCEPRQTSHHVFGLIATGNGTFDSVQAALTSWSKAKCLTFPVVQNITGTLSLVKPLFNASYYATTIHPTRPPVSHATPTGRNATSVRGRALAPRTTCSTVQVVSGNCYDSLASECGIKLAKFLQYNKVTDDEAGAQVAQDVTYSAIAYGVSIATSTLPSAAPGHWTPESQDRFSATLGSVLYGWSNATANQLYTLFNGSETYITLLTTLISDGKLIEGSGGAPSVGYQVSDSTSSDVEAFIGKAFFGYSIPTLWTISGSAAFVIDSGYPCSAQNPLTDYMTASTQESTYACYNDNLYYLVYPDGTEDGCSDHHEDNSTTWGGITLSELIEGSVNTYIANGNANGGPVADPMDALTLKDLSNQNITTPGYIRLPVCTAQVAWASWMNPAQSNSSASGYPCNPLQGVIKCSGYTYEDETTSASPSVSDCQTLMKNIAGTSGEWTTGIDG
ncbi:hypothetical protein PITC_004000 [Penicillium italicum]|uniref:Ecp2 effector protein-like domain-containing protein n=1 Tax=Penicillium italicum TaxID=40296 RepID=A0A0A2LAH4_PENIT|nr:hypothetical protein PITC_004000 [Penicillium italicum]